VVGLAVRHWASIATRGPGARTSAASGTRFPHFEPHYPHRKFSRAGVVAGLADASSCPGSSYNRELQLINRSAYRVKRALVSSVLCAETADSLPRAWMSFGCELRLREAPSFGLRKTNAYDAAGYRNCFIALWRSARDFIWHRSLSWPLPTSGALAARLC